jgi:hypothetical protein
MCLSISIGEPATTTSSQQHHPNEVTTTTTTTPGKGGKEYSWGHQTGPRWILKTIKRTDSQNHLFICIDTRQ